MPISLVMVPRKAGRFARDRFRKPFGFAVAYFGVSLLFLLFLFPALWWISLTAIVWIFFHESVEFWRPWLLGARGEEEVGRILVPLEAEGYRILNDLEKKRGNIDHVVIGPTGVFAIETKAWRGRVYVKAGRRLMCGPRDEAATVNGVIHDALEVRERLSRIGMVTWVHGVVALTRSTLPRGEIVFARAIVMEAKDLPAFIRSRAGTLTDHDVIRGTAAILGTDAPVEVGAVGLDA